MWEYFPLQSTTPKIMISILKPSGRAQPIFASLRSREVATFLTVFGTVLLIISMFGTSIPFYDEWDAEAINLYKPYLESTLHVSDLFAPHNGHRIVFTRTTALILFILNGGWDPELQMIVSGFLHALTAALLVKSNSGISNPQLKNVANSATVILFATPFSWMSILVAFQTQFYFMLLFAILAMQALSSNKLIRGFSLALLSFLSMTPGAFVFIAYSCLLVIGAINSQSIDRATSFKLLASMFLFFACMILRIGLFTDDYAYQAEDVGSFLVTLISTISWPWRPRNIIGIFIHFPFLMLLVRSVKSRSIPKLYLILGVFVSLQILAIAIFRGENGIAPPNRYWEILILGIWVNTMCAIYFLSIYRSNLVNFLCIGWLILAGFGLSLVAHESLTEGMPIRKAQNQSAQALITEYAQTGETDLIIKNEGLYVSYPDGGRLIEILSDPTVRELLPTSLDTDFKNQLGGEKFWLFRISWLISILGLVLFTMGPVSAGSKSINSGLEC